MLHAPPAAAWLLVTALLSATLCPAQERHAFERTRRQLDTLAEQHPKLAHLVVAVRGEGAAFVRAVGTADPKNDLPFQDVSLIPLGQLTRELLFAAFETAVADGELRWTDPIGASIPELDDELSARTWRELDCVDATFVPNYFRFLAGDGDHGGARELPEILAEHVFAPAAGYAYATEQSMTQAALMQLALTRGSEATWPELLRRAAREWHAPGVRAQEPAHRAQGVARHDSDGDPTHLWQPEVPSASGAVGSAQDIAALLRVLVQRDGREPSDTPDAPWCGWQSRDEDRFDVSYLWQPVAVPGVTGTARVYLDPPLAVFAFVNRSLGHEAVAPLHAAVLTDVLGEAEPDGSSRARFGGRALGRLPKRAPDARWGTTLTLRGARVPIQIETHGAAAILRAAEGTAISGRLSRIDDRVSGRWVVPAFAVHGGDQRTELSTDEVDGVLQGYVSYHVHLRDVGSIEHLPYPIRFEKLADDAERLPAVPPPER